MTRAHTRNGCGWVFAVGMAGLALAQEPGKDPLRPAGREWPPVIGAWFWAQGDLEPDGFKPFLDAAAAHSPYTLLATSCRGAEVVEPRVHEQVGKAVQYANAGVPREVSG